MNTAIQTMEIQNNDKKIKDMIREFQIEQIQIAKKENSYDELSEKYDTLIQEIREIKIQTEEASDDYYLVNDSESFYKSSINGTGVCFYVFDMWGKERLMIQQYHIEYDDDEDWKEAKKRVCRMIQEHHPDFLRWYTAEDEEKI